jgi:NAD(P)-dependent dehydrogenase (short-subunit alcohol dehydrogenase family)
MSKVWFITGTSKGFGRQFARAALGRGDKVAATARDVRALDDLVGAYGDLVLPIALDVTDHPAVAAAVRRAKEQFGRLDVIINNAGYGLFGAAEEITERQLRDQLEVKPFGSVAVTKSVLPLLRQQGFGHLIQISTVGGVGAFPYLSAYNASKWAIEGFLPEEVTHTVVFLASDESSYTTGAEYIIDGGLTAA